MTKKSGRMTESWTPTNLDSFSSLFPHVHHHMEVMLFKDYYQSQDDVLVLTQEAWDRKFRSWCARAERRWLEQHSQDEPRFDDLGMPINPKPLIIKEKP